MGYAMTYSIRAVVDTDLQRHVDTLWSVNRKVTERRPVLVTTDEIEEMIRWAWKYI